MRSSDLRLGDCLATLRAMPDASVDSVVTDPPYGLGKEPKERQTIRHRTKCPESSSTCSALSLWITCG